jgi:predicted AlkP superfamily phosphohydrolase/phosphomutase
MRRGSVNERLLIIGWDGADWEVLDDLVRSGTMPNLRAMIDSGARGVLNSTIPTHSWAAWPTFLTGLHPSGHSVYDFIERDPAHSDRRTPASSRSVRAPTFLHRLSDAGYEVRAGNIPMTYPPEPVRGRMISGVVIPEGAEFVYPPEWQLELDARASFPVNGLGWQRFELRQEALVREAVDLIEARTASFEVLLQGEWRVATCVYVEPDRLQHPFGAYLLPSHPHHERALGTPIAEGLRRVFRALDEALERLVSVSGPDTTLVLMSDHGFRPITRLASMNALLEQLGFAKRHAGATVRSVLRRSKLLRGLQQSRVGPALKRAARPISGVDWAATRAYESVAGGGIALALEGREEKGTVPAAAYESVRDELREALLAYRDSETGERIVEAVLTSEDLPSGPYDSLAPDLIAVPAPMWAFGNTDALSAVTGWPTGTHRLSGILLASEGGARRRDLGVRYVGDLAPTALAFCGVTTHTLDGTAIDSIVGGSRAPDVDGRPVPVADREPVPISEQENEEMLQRLRELGYIE